VPEVLRSLVFVLFCATAVFLTCRPGLAPLFPSDEFTRFRNSWIGATIVAFVSGSFWIFVIGTTVAAFLLHRRSASPAALFPGLLLCLPAYGADIPGFGLVNYLFHLNVPRLLALVLLLPAAFLMLRTHASRTPRVRGPDGFFAAYALLQLALASRQDSITNAMRVAFMIFTDMVLPYYVLSRALQSRAALRQALAGVLAGALVLSAVAAVEFAKQWLVYSSLGGAWGVRDAPNHYLGRSGFLRVRATAGHPIALGFVVLVGTSALLAFRQTMRVRWRRIFSVVLAFGLFFPISRGPWLGAAAMLCIYISTGTAVLKNLTKAAAAGAGLLLAIGMAPGGDRLVRLLPFVGDVEKESIDYRQQLLEASLTLLAEHPMLGPPDYRGRLAQAGLVQGEGIVDIVNTYVRVALDSGVIGLGLFSAFFLSTMWAVLGARRQSAPLPQDAVALDNVGRGLVAGLVGIAITIATVSSISVIPWLYWTYAGLCVAYVRIVQAEVVRAPRPARPSPTRSQLPVRGNHVAGF